MKESTNVSANVGDVIRIIALTQEPDGRKDPSESNYIGKVGRVEYIDDLGILHGTWGGLGILPKDSYEILKEVTNPNEVTIK